MVLVTLDAKVIERMKAERTDKLPHLSIQMHVGKGVSVDS